MRGLINWVFVSWLLVLLSATLLLLGTVDRAHGALDAKRNMVSGLWLGTSREPTTAEVDGNFKKWIEPVYDDLYDGRGTRPGIYVQAAMIKSFYTGPDRWDFSIIDNLMKTEAVRKHGASVNLNLRFEGKVFPSHWESYLVKGTTKVILDLSRPEVVKAVKEFVTGFAKEINKHSNIHMVNVGEMSGSGEAGKEEVIKHMLSEFKTAYVGITQNAATFDKVKALPGVARFMSGPKLFESCGRSGKVWPAFDCGGRYEALQYGNLLGVKPPKSYPPLYAGASIEPNEFKIVNPPAPSNNPWGKPLPQPALSSTRANVDYKVYLWYLSGDVKNPERANTYGIKAVNGVAPASMIVIYPTMGKVEWTGRLQNFHAAVRTFGRRGVNSLFNATSATPPTEPPPVEPPPPDDLPPPTELPELPEECPALELAQGQTLYNACYAYYQLSKPFTPAERRLIQGCVAVCTEPPPPVEPPPDEPPPVEPPPVDPPDQPLPPSLDDCNPENLEALRLLNASLKQLLESCGGFCGSAQLEALTAILNSIKQVIETCKPLPSN